jgi:hypothetical protein
MHHSLFNIMLFLPVSHLQLNRILPKMSIVLCLGSRLDIYGLCQLKAWLRLMISTINLCIWQIFKLDNWPPKFAKFFHTKNDFHLMPQLYIQQIKYLCCRIILKIRKYYKINKNKLIKILFSKQFAIRMQIIMQSNSNEKNAIFLNISFTIPVCQLSNQPQIWLQWNSGL